MSLTFYLDKGASLDPEAPCLILDGASLSYGEVVELSHAVARALRRSGVRPGDKVGILSANDPTAFSCVFGIARAGAVWCPINPRNAAAENAELLDLFDCSTLIFQPAFDDLVAWIERGVRPEGEDLLAADLSHIGLKWTPILHPDDPLAPRR